VLASKYSALPPICKVYLKIIIFWRQRHTKRNSWLKSHLFAMEARSDEERFGHPKLKLVTFQPVSIAKTSSKKMTCRILE
jgi:hypothetical protein